jgi:hypothetical protein
MTIQITTHGDALRHTTRRVIVAVINRCSNRRIDLVQLGVDTGATVSVGFVMTFGITIGVIISALLTGGPTYRSALVMQELALTRAELLRISRRLTDGLLSRRG